MSDTSSVGSGGELLASSRGLWDSLVGVSLATVSLSFPPPTSHEFMRSFQHNVQLTMISTSLRWFGFVRLALTFPFGIGDPNNW